MAMARIAGSAHSAAFPPSPAWRRIAAAWHHRTIQAVPREASGGRAAAKERAQGRVPAILISLSGPDQDVKRAPKQMVTTDAKQIREILKESPYFCTTPIKLQVRAGLRSETVLQSGTVLPLRISRKEETGEILNLAMAWAEKGKELKVKVPLVFKGEDLCPGLKKGGHLRKVRSFLTHKFLVEEIPQKIEVDLAKLDIGERIVLHEKLVCEILASKPSESKPEPNPVLES
ncbi:hypothetical protein LUZ60_004971 [Juncus effusus]|nr:hypothetical protein LUZ60_004971 [Juncus effusus]